MLNTFPNLLFLGLLAPFLIRVTVGVMFIWIGYSYLFKDKGAVISQLKTVIKSKAKFVVLFGSLFEIVTGLFLVVGFLTQIFAIVGMLIALEALIGKWKYSNLDKILKYSKQFYILIFVASLSLLFSGAGAFAFDLPL